MNIFFIISVCFIVKTRKEAKQMEIKDSISATRARVEELERIMQAQRARRDDYAAVISQQSLSNILSLH